MIRFSNCKINLGLYVTAKRSDGYHDIESVMYPVRGLGDAIEVIHSDCEGVEFSSSGLLVDCVDSKNLCVKAYRLMQERYGIGGVKIHLHKVVPFGAGLGGGSSDAVCVLEILNDLFALDLGVEQLESLAGELGSDTIFFVRNTPAIVSGRGDVITPIDLDLRGYYLLLVKPDVAVGTAEAYRGVIPALPEIPLRETILGDVCGWKDRLKNDFEPSVFVRHAELSALKNELYAMGAVYASMSGSGATVFGLFDREPSTDGLFSDCFVYGEKL